MDTFSQKEGIKGLQKVIGFLSICISIVILILSGVKYYLNPLSYINVTLFYGHSEAIFIWTIFGLFVLRRYYPYQFLFVLIPLYLMSDLIWVTEASIIHPQYMQQTVFNIHWEYYLIELSSIVIVVILVFKLYKHFNYYWKLQITRIIFFIGFSLIYMFILKIPIVASWNSLDITNPILIPNNIYWEETWQLIFLMCFGFIFLRDKGKYDIGWYFR